MIQLVGGHLLLVSPFSPVFLPLAEDALQMSLKSGTVLCHTNCMQTSKPHVKYSSVCLDLKFGMEDVEVLFFSATAKQNKVILYCLEVAAKLWFMIAKACTKCEAGRSINQQGEDAEHSPQRRSSLGQKHKAWGCSARALIVDPTAANGTGVQTSCGLF